MKARLAALVQRRAQLVLDIGDERERMSALASAVRTQLALAGLGLLAGRLLRRSRWLRRLMAAGTLAAVAAPLAARFLQGRR